MGHTEWVHCPVCGNKTRLVQMDNLRYTQPGRIHGSDDRLMLKVISRFNDSIDLLWRKHSWKIPLTLHGRDFPGERYNTGNLPEILSKRSC